MSWDALQREVLAALGHTPYVCVDATSNRPQESGHGAQGAGTDMSGRDATGALLGALLRAANVREDQLASLQPHLPPLRALAGNAAAKRALWPTLRALRAPAGTP